MAQVLGLFVPLAVALVTTLRWPSLPRRIREHASLLKELPEGVRKSALQDLLEAELEELARAGQQRMSQRSDRRIALGRIAVVVLTFLLAIPAAFLDPDMGDGEGPLVDLNPVFKYYLVLAILFLGFSSTWWISGFAIRVSDKLFIRSQRSAPKSPAS